MSDFLHHAQKEAAARNKKCIPRRDNSNAAHIGVPEHCTKSFDRETRHARESLCVVRPSHNTIV